MSATDDGELESLNWPPSQSRHDLMFPLAILIDTPMDKVLNSNLNSIHSTSTSEVDTHSSSCTCAIVTNSCFNLLEWLTSVNYSKIALFYPVSLAN